MLAKIKQNFDWLSVSKFQYRVFLILLLTSLLQIIIVSQVSTSSINTIIEEQIGQKAVNQAKLVAHIPLVQRALEEKSPELIQELVTPQNR